jgi:hypothetical protein
MTIKPSVLVVSAFALAVISYSAGSVINGDSLKDNISPLGQLAQNTNRSMEQYYEDKGRYPKSLSELSIDVVHADGGNQSDIDHALYIVEGPLAIVILDRHIGPCVVLQFRDGKSQGTTYLGERSDQ